jgi:hypothetical protein
MRSHGQLGSHPPLGFISASSFAIGAVPWLGGERGYADWCLLEGSWAMDSLNGPRPPSHLAEAARDGVPLGKATKLSAGLPTATPRFYLGLYSQSWRNGC